MVDSVKNYGITGVADNIELGKQGPKISDSASEVSLTDTSGNSVINATIANASANNEAITYQQFLNSSSAKLTVTKSTVSYDSGTIFLGELPADSTVMSVTVTKLSDWTGLNSNTEITIGDDNSNTRFFSDFDDTSQVTLDSNYTYTSDSEVFAYVSQGGATAGNAEVAILHTGTIGTNRSTVTLNYLVVGGGGGGGTGYDNAGGGGGAGGMALAGSKNVLPGTYNVVVGNGGDGGPDTRTNTSGNAGASSSALGITALGGGAGLGSRIGGGPGAAQVGSSTAPTGGGGSGGGGDGKGGGGATGAGTGDGTSPGSGGAGLASSITGSSVTYASGASGGYNGGPYNGASGAANTGNGGGGGSSPSFNSAAGGSGGSGVVVISHPSSEPVATTTGTVTVTTSGGNRIYRFTGNGSITI